MRELLKPPRTPPLGAGTPVRAAGERLRALNVTSLFAPATVRDRMMGSACLAGLWLWFDHLDESHALSQDIHTPGDQPADYRHAGQQWLVSKRSHGKLERIRSRLGHCILHGVRANQPDQRYSRRHAYLLCNKRRWPGRFRSTHH